MWHAWLYIIGIYVYDFELFMYALPNPETCTFSHESFYLDILRFEYYKADCN